MGGVRTRLLAVAALLALATGCGGDPVATTDPGHPLPSETGPTPTGPTQTGTPAQTRDIGPAFRAFARGGPLPPLADEVQLYLGNALTGVVTERDARDRRAWATCTELGSYAAYTCPLSPLDPLRRHADVAYSDRPQGLCMPTYGPVPPDLRRLDRVVIGPAKGSTERCAQNFAIQLFTDDDGDLVAVSTLLGER